MGSRGWIEKQKPFCFSVDSNLARDLISPFCIALIGGAQKKMKEKVMKRIATATVIGTLVVLFGMASAEARPGRGRHFKGKGMGMFLDGVTLTEAQEAEMAALREEMQEQTKGLHEQTRELHKQMHDLWQVDSPDGAAIKALQKKIHNLHGQMENISIDFRLEMLAILTPEQRAELRAQMAERAEKRGSKKGFGKGNGQGRGPGSGGNPDCPWADQDTTEAE
jgi:protein CpxP